MGREQGLRKSPPTRDIRAPSLRVDPEKYPNLSINPGLERALRIRQELEKGRPREEAVALADAAMGRIGPAKAGRPKPAGRPASGSRPGGKAERPRKPARR